MPQSIMDTASLAASQITFRQLADAMPQMVWSTLPNGDHDYYNAQWYRFTGMPEGSTDGDAWNGMFHPDDQDRAWSVWGRSLNTGEDYEIEYRLRHRSGEYRWVLGRALPVRDANGSIVRWVGTCTDIHHAKQMAEENKILSTELSHRIKNIFAVIHGLIGLSARRFPESKQFSTSLQSRIASLGKAHNYVRPHTEESQPHDGQRNVIGLLNDLLSPYPAMDEGRLTIAGQMAPIDDRAATPIGLIFHELATNSAKYGALSVPTGSVAIVVSKDAESVTLSWTEEGGPTPVPPVESGFGTRLIDLSIVDQLGGVIDREWRPEGLFVTLKLEANRLSRDALAKTLDS